eukprot:gene21674-49394_t
MAKQVTQVFKAQGVAAAIDFNFYPFGNGHFATKKCPETGHIGCWAKECSQDPPDADCFSGVPGCQHGPDECTANAIEGCVIQHYPNATQYWPFVDCFEAKGGSRISGWENCAQSAGLDQAKIKACYTDPAQRNVVDKKMAQGCPPEYGVPNIYVNDKEGSASVAHVTPPLRAARSALQRPAEQSAADRPVLVPEVDGAPTSDATLARYRK